MNRLNLPRKIYFKPGSMQVALRELSEIYQLKRAFLVSGPGDLAALTVVGDWLRRCGLRTAEFFTIGDPPSFADIRSAQPKLGEFEPDVIVGVGGGAAMSAAKAMWAVYENPELDLKREETITTGKKAKLVLVATDLESGAQNSPFALLKDDEGAPCELKSFALLPEISVADAELLKKLSPEQRTEASQGLLTRCLAALETADEYTNGLLEEAVRLIKENQTDRPEALEKLQSAAALYGAACGNMN